MIARVASPRPAPQATARVRRLPAFRLAVCVGLVALLAGVLASHLRGLEDEVERARFAQQTRALRLAVATAAVLRDARGDAAGLAALEGSNPVSLLSTPPSNYLGEIFDASAAGSAPGSWWFDLHQRELVYAPRSARNSAPAGARRPLARFKIARAQSDDGETRRGVGGASDRPPGLVVIEVPRWLGDPHPGPRDDP